MAQSLGGVIRSIHLYMCGLMFRTIYKAYKHYVPRGDTKRLSNVNIVVQTLCFRLCVSDYILVLDSRFHSVGHDVT